MDGVPDAGRSVLPRARAMRTPSTTRDGGELWADLVCDCRPRHRDHLQCAAELEFGKVQLDALSGGNPGLEVDIDGRELALTAPVTDVIGRRHVRQRSCGRIADSRQTRLLVDEQVVPGDGNPAAAVAHDAGHRLDRHAWLVGIVLSDKDFRNRHGTHAQRPVGVECPGTPGRSVPGGLLDLPGGFRIEAIVDLAGQHRVATVDSLIVNGPGAQLIWAGAGDHRRRADEPGGMGDRFGPGDGHRGNGDRRYPRQEGDPASSAVRRGTGHFRSGTGHLSSTLLASHLPSMSSIVMATRLRSRRGCGLAALVIHWSTNSTTSTLVLDPDLTAESMIVPLLIALLSMSTSRSWLADWLYMSLNSPVEPSITWAKF